MMTRCVVCGLYGGSEWYQDGLNVVDKLMIVDIVDGRMRIGILSKCERSMLVEEWIMGYHRRGMWDGRKKRNVVHQKGVE